MSKRDRVILDIITVAAIGAALAQMGLLLAGGRLERWEQFAWAVFVAVFAFLSSSFARLAMQWQSLAKSWEHLFWREHEHWEELENGEAR